MPEAAGYCYCYNSPCVMACAYLAYSIREAHGGYFLNELNIPGQPQMNEIGFAIQRPVA